MKKLLSIITSAVLVTVMMMPVRLRTYSAEAPEISAKAAILISADTGEVIYAHNADKKLPMASTTKIMTALLCLESGGLDEEFVVDSEAIKVEGSSMGLREGDIVTKYALCCGMLLPSGNDAANAAAVKIAGSIEAFAVLMNERAEELGLSRTFFVTPSGLEGEGHGSSARDMALLAAEALKNEKFREICSKSSMQVEFGDPPYKRWLKNTNKLLTTCEGVYGVKTGFTDEAGRCLVSACERNGIDLICVTLNDRSDWHDHAALYDYGFEKVKKYSLGLPKSLSLDLAGAESDSITVAPAEENIDISALSCDSSEYGMQVVSSPFVYAPVCKGEELASLRVTFNGREIRNIPLYACEDAPIKKSPPKKEENKSFISRIINKLGKIFS